MTLKELQLEIAGRLNAGCKEFFMQGSLIFELHRPSCDSILSHMKNTSVTPPRARAEIIADLTALPGAVQGKICEDRRVLADGTTAVYHNLQYWSGGRNHTIRIPGDRLAAFREAVEGGAKARRLLSELSEADAGSILSGGSPLKKNSRGSSFRAPRRSTRSSTPRRSR